jgi:hypothetical protein
MNNHHTSQIRSAVTIFLAVVGLILMALAVLADELGLDITPGFGVVQMVAFLSGLTMMTLAAFLFVGSKRPAEAPHSLQADIGARLVATGLVFAYVAGLSDVIGIGTHVEPSFARPFVGPLQLGGIIIGLVAILAGLAMAYTSRGQRESSSLEFLVHHREETAPEESKQPHPGK